MGRTSGQATAAALLAALLLVGCSSAPKPKQEINSVKNEAAQYTTAGNAYFDQGNYSEAQKFFDLALQDNLSIYNEPGMAGSYNSLGKVYLTVGDLDAAEADFRNAFDVATRLNDLELLIETESNFGELQLARGRYSEALATFKDAVAKAANPQSLLAARLSHNIGAAYKELGDYASALEFLKKALDLHLALAAAGEQASDYYMIASVHSKQGDFKQATDYANLALSSDQKMENKPGIASDLFALGLIAERSGDLKTAYTRYVASFEVYKSIGLVANVKELLGKLAQVAADLGRLNEAASYRQALKGLGGG